MSHADLFEPADGARSTIALSDRQRLDWLRLIRSESIGPRTFRSLINRHGGAGVALDALPGLVKRAGRAPLRICTVQEAEAEIDGLSQLGARLVALGEKDYPATLAAIDTAPPLLAMLGKPQAAGRPCIAIVGSRNASAAGSRMAEKLAQALGLAGFTVVSGLARGLDSRAHEASLPTGTVAVLAGGLAKPYPRENHGLLQRIAETGCVVSEMPLDCEPRAREFPRRNRIVSGMSLGTVVVEAARRSGSLITARFALEQGREVFAVPGSPLDQRAEGTNDLIKSGATMVTGPEDIIEVIRPMLAGGPLSGRQLREDTEAQQGEPLWDELDLPGLAQGETPRSLAEPFAYEPELDRAATDDPLARVVNLLGPAPVRVDDLVRLLSLSPRAVQAALTELDLAGRLARLDGGRVALR
jgi:DNA processing protein